MSIETIYYSTKIIKHNFNKISQTVCLCLKEAIFNVSRQWEDQSCSPPPLICLLTSVALKENRRRLSASLRCYAIYWGVLCMIITWFLVFLLLFLKKMSLISLIVTSFTVKLPESSLTETQITHDSLH